MPRINMEMIASSPMTTPTMAPVLLEWEEGLCVGKGRVEAPPLEVDVEGVIAGFRMGIDELKI